MYTCDCASEEKVEHAKRRHLFCKPKVSSFDFNLQYVPGGIFTLGTVCVLSIVSVYHLAIRISKV